MPDPPPNPSPPPRTTTTTTTIRILDGGLGTSLEHNHGISFTPSSSPLWSSHLLVSDPATLLLCQKSFAAIPVDVLLTATYQVSIQGFAATKTAEHPSGIADASHIPPFLDKAIQIAHEAAKARTPCAAAVALSLGPYGACMIPSQEYSGAYDAEHSSEEALYLWHRQRMELFARVVPPVRRRITYMALETIPRLDEIVALRRALAAVPELSSGIPFWMSCLFPHEDDDNTPDGSSPEAILGAMLDPALAEEAVPWAVGINCTKVWKLDSLLRRYEAAIRNLLHEGTVERWPALVLYPDGTNGEVYNTTTKQWELPQGAAEQQQDRVPWETQLTQAVRATEARGNWPEIIVGGCCRALPSDIKRLRDALTN
ncbi:Homocysteine S-methyltransferase [Trichoderma citrinoviride]|uniref:Homocysteine S-methyltransferase n=1 Tax=Trichoderma citrinoviride TaxID=58853 RepID=A0A2T4B646_9HYPO|nr:Homocysteine S-methyltransferase [Trichoderma citrinoviride]PTB64681.1 Homocysteine S-methyltransferase [Trichoderma citrinoviride]